MSDCKDCKEHQASLGHSAFDYPGRNLCDACWKGWQALRDMRREEATMRDILFEMGEKRLLCTYCGALHPVVARINHKDLITCEMAPEGYLTEVEGDGTVTVTAIEVGDE